MVEVQKYRMTFKCHDFECGHEFVKITTNMNLKNPRCPMCKEKKDQMRLNRIGDGAVSETDLIPSPPRDTNVKNIYRCYTSGCSTTFALARTEQFVPNPLCPKCGNPETAFRGTNAPNVMTAESRHKNKAVDSTAEIIMQDYKMTDIRDDARMGETSTPKLPPAMQAQADNFFSPQKNSMIGKSAAIMGKRAIRGSYSGNSANMGSIIRPESKPKINVIHKD